MVRDLSSETIKKEYEDEIPMMIFSDRRENAEPSSVEEDIKEEI